mmetsp:Transcript_22619/g.58176  ORF Transcript_22619/g.58176 Transcript_22619/m.58176 type:complete len:280 (+) Transcript_22619:297-1136(+)
MLGERGAAYPHPDQHQPKCCRRSASVLPDAHPVDLQVRVIALPRGQPLVARAPKVVDSMHGLLMAVMPRHLRAIRARHRLVEVPVHATARKVHHEVELLVVRRVDVGAAGPRVVKLGPVRPFAQPLLPKGLVELGVNHAVGVVVNVRVQLRLRPVQPKRVKVPRVVGVVQLPRAMVHVPRVLGRVWPPVQRRADRVHASALQAPLRLVGVAAALDQVDLARGGPLAVLLVAGEQPDRRPQPVAARHLGAHLEPAVLEGEGFVGADLGRLDRVQDVAAHP